MEYNPNVWNPLWQALYRIDGHISKAEGRFDPLALKWSYLLDDLGQIALRVETWEKEPGNADDMRIRGAYLLGLAAGLKYAEVPQGKLDELVESYKRE